jgi:hypothetical protein
VFTVAIVLDRRLYHRANRYYIPVMIIAMAASIGLLPVSSGFALCLRNVLYHLLPVH